VVGSPAVFGDNQSMEIARAQVAAGQIARKFYQTEIFPRGVPDSAARSTKIAFTETKSQDAIQGVTHELLAYGLRGQIKQLQRWRLAELESGDH